MEDVAEVIVVGRLDILPCLLTGGRNAAQGPAAPQIAPTLCSQFVRRRSHGPGTRPLSNLRTSAVSSALAAKLVARVFRATSRARRKRNSPITHRGARAALCSKASPLAAGTGDAGGSGSPSTLRVTAGLVSCNSFNRRIIDFEHASHVAAIR